MDPETWHHNYRRCSAYRVTLFQSGEGANLAMQDGAELALVITSVTATAETEERMCRHAAVAVEESAVNLEAFIHPDAPGTALKRLTDVMARHRGVTIEHSLGGG